MATAIVYGRDTGIIRRIICTDDPTTFPQHVEDGEAILAVSDAILVPRDDGTGQMVPSLDLAYAAQQAATGIVAQCSRCLVIEDVTGDVKSVIHADPTRDTVEGHTLYPDFTGDVGYLPDDNGDFTINPNVIPDDPTTDSTST